MKPILTTIIVALSICPALARTSVQTEDSIQSIRQDYARINKNVARYRRVKKELSGFSTEGGDLIAYFDDAAIVKMVATFLGESGKAVEEYYYRDGKLIFVYRRESTYDKPLSGKVVSIKETRFYFNNDKLIRWIDENGKQVATDSSEYQEKQKEYLDSSKLFSEGARSRKPTIESSP